MKIGWIAWKDISIRLRDRRGLILLLLMPLLLTLILGSVFHTTANTMPTMTIAVYNGDTGNFGASLLSNVLQGPELKPYITLKKVASAQTARDLVQTKQADAGIAILSSTQVDVLQDPGKQTIGQIVRSIVTSYTERYATVSGSMQAVVSDLYRQKSNGSVSPPSSPEVQQVIATLSQSATAKTIQIQETAIGKNPVSGKQYYSAGMAVMFLLFNIAVGAKSILAERETETLNRLLATPTSRAGILFGKFLGTLGFTALQFFVLIVATKLLFGVDWGTQPGQWIVIGVAYATAVAGLSMLIAAFLRNAQTADLVSTIGVQLMSMLGGSMVPLNYFPDVIREIARITPNNWALTGLLDVMSGTTWQALLLPVAVLGGMGLLSLLLGTWRLQAAR